MRPTRVVFDARWVGEHGIGRHAREVESRLPGTIQRLSHGPPPVAPAEPLWLSRYLWRERPDLFVTPLYNLPVVRPHGTKCVPTIHDVIHLDLPGAIGQWKAAYFRLQILPRLRRSAHILTVSDASRDRLCDVVGLEADQVTVTGNGISECFTYDPRASRSASRILCIASNRPHKGFIDLLAALERMPRAGQGLEVCIVGLPETVLPHLRQLRGLRCRLHLLGVLDDRALAEQFRSANVFISPSLVEGFGLPPLEALACGTPVVVTDIPAHRETMGSLQNVTFVEARSPDAIAAGLIESLSRTPEPLVREEVAQIVRRTHTWDATVSRILRVIEWFAGMRQQ